MRVNIYTSFNGVGLQKDYEILKGIIEPQGNIVDYADWKQRHGHRPDHADVALHLEIPRPDLMSLAPKNIIIPNPEWFDTRWASAIKRFDAIWCKTQDCLRIFSKHHKKCIFTSFTSLDFRRNTGKVKQMIHVQGASEFKGTHEILNVWAANDMPRLFLMSKKLQAANGNVACGGFMADEDFRNLMNACLIHLCPSYYEGFAHYIWEAMSCGAVVLTTNCPPMNEFITDKRLLITCGPAWMHHFGEMHRPNVDELKKKVLAVYDMPEAELVELGEKNREKYLQNDKQFREKLLNLLA